VAFWSCAGGQRPNNIRKRKISRKLTVITTASPPDRSIQNIRNNWPILASRGPKIGASYAGESAGDKKSVITRDGEAIRSSTGGTVIRSWRYVSSIDKKIKNVFLWYRKTIIIIIIINYRDNNNNNIMWILRTGGAAVKPLIAEHCGIDPFTSS